MARLHLSTLVFEGRLAQSSPSAGVAQLGLNLSLGGLPSMPPLLSPDISQVVKGGDVARTGREGEKSLKNSKDRIPNNHPQIIPSVSEMKRSSEGEDAENSQEACSPGQMGFNLSLTSSFLT